MTAFSDRVAVVHVPKTGGHACRGYMRQHLGGVREIDELYPGWPSLGHVPLRDYPKFIGRPLDSWDLIIGVVRNPYHQQVSQWVFWRDEYARGFRHVAREHAAMHPDLNSWFTDPMADWHVWDTRYVEDKVKTRAEGRPELDGYQRFGGYFKYWLAVDGVIPPNVRIVRFENLGTEFPAVLAPYHDGPVGDMAHVNVGPRGGNNPMLYYSEWARKQVESKFPWAFEHYYEKAA